MATKDNKKPKKKKPRHTKLVTPGISTQKTKRKEPVAERKGRPTKATTQATTQNTTKATIQSPRKGTGLPPAAHPVTQTGAVFDVQKAPVEDFDAALVQNMVAQQTKAKTTGKAGVSSTGTGAASGKKQSGGNQQSSASTRRPKGQTMQFPVIKPAEAEPKEPEKLPLNARRMPQKPSGHSAALQAGRRKKRRRWLRVLALLLAVVCGVLFYTTGLYLSAATSLADLAEGVRIGAASGAGYPNSFMVSGFGQAKPMGSNGFVALGDKDMAMMAASGKELLRIQHGYVTPSMAVGATRVCVYNRGSTEYTVTNRSRVLLKNNTENSILFAAVSPGGSLALATASQYRSTIEVFSPSTYDEWRWSWSSANDTPVMGVFESDNKTLALACVSPSGATIASVIYLFKTDRSAQQGAEMSRITVASALPVQMEFVAGKLVVVYDSGYAALYNKAGEELARYDYGGKILHTASLNTDGLALVFGSASQDNSHLTLLNTALQLQAETTITGTLIDEVLVTRGGVFVLAGQEVLAYTRELLLADTQFSEAKNYGIVWVGQPILLGASGAYPLQELLTGAVASGSEGLGAADSAADSASAGHQTESLPADEPEAGQQRQAEETQPEDRQPQDTLPEIG